MKLFRTLKTALRALDATPCGVLTTLGIVIGVAAVITMMEIGNGSSSPSSAPSPTWGPTVVVMPGTLPAAASASARAAS